MNRLWEPFIYYRVIWLLLGISIIIIGFLLGQIVRKRLQKIWGERFLSNLVRQIASDLETLIRGTSVFIAALIVVVPVIPVRYNGLDRATQLFSLFLVYNLAFMGVATMNGLGLIVPRRIAENENLDETDKRNLQTVLPLVVSVSKYIIYGFAFLTALSCLGVDLTPVFGATAILTLIVGLAAQHTIQDVLNTLNIFLDHYYFVGSEVQVPGLGRGKVSKITVRSTFIDMDDARGQYTLIIANRLVEKILVFKSPNTLLKKG